MELIKSAITSRAWPRPLQGAFLIPPALLVVADLLTPGDGQQYSFYWILVTGHWLLVTGYWILDTGYLILVICHLSLVTGHWLLVTGFWFLVTCHLSFINQRPPAELGV